MTYPRRSTTPPAKEEAGAVHKASRNDFGACGTRGTGPEGTEDDVLARAVALSLEEEQVAERFEAELAGALLASQEDADERAPTYSANSDGGAHSAPGPLALQSGGEGYGSQESIQAAEFDLNELGARTIGPMDQDDDDDLFQAAIQEAIEASRREAHHACD